MATPEVRQAKRRQEEARQEDTGQEGRRKEEVRPEEARQGKTRQRKRQEETREDNGDSVPKLVILHYTRPQTDKEQALAMFEQIDVDNSGELDYKEREAALTRV